MGTASWVSLSCSAHSNLLGRGGGGATWKGQSQPHAQQWASPFLKKTISPARTPSSLPRFSEGHCQAVLGL